MKRCHIFAGGIINDTNFIQIDVGDMIICADKGYLISKKLGLTPDIIVGDFDSYKGELNEQSEIIRSVPEKDDTDTLLALKLAIERGADNVIIYGALGGRFDHTMANIQTLKYASEHGCEAMIADSDNIIMLHTEGERFYTRKDGWYFSFFAFTDNVFVEELSGVKYPLKKIVVTTGFPIGVSNEITSDAAYLKIKNGTAIIVLSKM